MASIAQKFYVYDPGVHAGDEIGGQRVSEEKDNGLYVLATTTWAQYFKDQGLLGSEPLSKLSGAGKKLLGQITRGRSDNLDDEDFAPTKVPKYSKATQSGSPEYALVPPRKQKKEKKAKQSKKATEAPRAVAPVVTDPTRG